MCDFRSHRRRFLSRRSRLDQPYSIGRQPASPAKRFRLGTFPGLRDTRRWSERNPLDHGDARAWRIERTYPLSNQLELDVLAEVHDETELREALEAGASIIGVNNRDLKTFDVSLDTSLHLGKLIPDDRLFVVESGIHQKSDVDLLLDAGADAFLIGEHFLTASDPAAALRALL